jgi:UDP-3-O-[3-hydroxymyristoyl] glucosamine N-acyltransferase
VVKQVLAVAGSVRIEPGATVRKGVVAVGGSVRVAAGAHVGEDVLALGGQLDVREGAVVGGSRLALDLSIAGVDVRQKVLEGLHVKGCVIEPKGGAVER